MSKTAKRLFIAAIVLNVTMAIINVYFGAWIAAMLSFSTAGFVWLIYKYAKLFCRQSKFIDELIGENCELSAKLHKERMKNAQRETLGKAIKDLQYIKYVIEHHCAFCNVQTKD